MLAALAGWVHYALYGPRRLLIPLAGYQLGVFLVDLRRRPADRLPPPNEPHDLPPRFPTHTTLCPLTVQSNEKITWAMQSIELFDTLLILQLFK